MRLKYEPSSEPLHISDVPNGRGRCPCAACRGSVRGSSPPSRCTFAAPSYTKWQQVDDHYTAPSCTKLQKLITRKCYENVNFYHCFLYRHPDSPDRCTFAAPSYTKWKNTIGPTQNGKRHLPRPLSSPPHRSLPPNQSFRFRGSPLHKMAKVDGYDTNLL